MLVLEVEEFRSEGSGRQGLENGAQAREAEAESRLRKPIVDH
jgi:hypothetical protein